MVDAILRAIYSEADETSAQLERLLAPLQSQRQANLQRLERVVAGLSDSAGGDPAEATVERHERPEDRRLPAADPVPFVALPQRTTHGGPFGPKVREKLIAEALGERGW